MQAIILSLLSALSAQTAPEEGIRERAPRVHALTGARLVLEPGRAVDRGTLVIRDGLIEAAGAEATPPPGARLWDRSGLTITAGFIDLGLEVEWPEDPDGDRGRSALSWNPSIRAERSAILGPRLEGKRAASHREVGFAVALLSPAGGVLSGTGAVVGLHDPDQPRPVMAERAAMFGGLENRRGGYPASRMGAVALLRQTFYDARWYRDAWDAYARDPARQERPEVNRALEALAPVLRGELPLALRARDALELLALRRVAEEFGVGAWYLGSGEEYCWLGEIERAPGGRHVAVRLVIPLDFPPPPAVERPDDAEDVPLRALEEWARAPENAVRLHRAGIRFAFTARGLKSAKDFPERIRRVLERGLPKEIALAALTTVPAELAGLSGRLGTLDRGKIAAFTVFDGEPFAEGTRVVEVWIDGERYPVEKAFLPDLRGAWTLSLKSAGNGGRFPEIPEITLQVRGEREKPRVEFESAGKPKAGGNAPRARLELDDEEVTLVLSGEVTGRPGLARLAGRVDRDPAGGAELSLSGRGELGDGTAVEFRARRAAPPAREPGKATREAAEAAAAAESREPLPSPLGERGRLDPPYAPRLLLVEGATIWTSAGAGTIEEGSLLVEDGKVRAVGKGLAAPPGAETVSARGLHLTPGIVDPHSHTAIAGGVNEGTQAVTAEVRVTDALDPDDMNLYRQLAGGVTSAQLLHGSANPIGGQSAIIKLRWGEGPSGLLVEDPPRTIKFALGENPKRSNRDGPDRRYPQTRMGVEQILRDSFLAAREYARRWEEHRRDPAGLRLPPRRDLELEALAEVLRGERLVHCHSYRQDEILMLLRLAEEMGFRVSTFQHVLEGYKVAREIAAHGAGASTFSDWWAYKFEVYDAIPYNGALLHRAGVLTSFNSDSNELARRLNLEAAKAVKYGGVPPEEALRFVTLNPARQIGMGKRVGSLEPGKDADFAIWSGSPLSTYGICLSTWIDGRRIWSREEDLRLRERDEKRRRVLIQRILLEKEGGGRKEPPAEPSPALAAPAGGGER